MSTSIGKLLVGAFFFGTQSYEYSTAPKGENKQTRILRKGDIRLYRKLINILHCSGYMYMAY